jgi:hypothetical protein
MTKQIGLQTSKQSKQQQQLKTGAFTSLWLKDLDTNTVEINTATRVWLKLKFPNHLKCLNSVLMSRFPLEAVSVTSPVQMVVIKVEADGENVTFLTSNLVSNQTSQNKSGRPYRTQDLRLLRMS